MRNGKRNCINPLPTPLLQYCMLYTKVELFSDVYSSWKALDETQPEAEEATTGLRQATADLGKRLAAA